MDGLIDLLPDVTKSVAFSDYLFSIVLSIALSALLTLWVTVRVNRRSEALDRIDRQLHMLYGPLRMLRHAGETNFRTFKSKYFPNRPELFSNGVGPSDADYAAWRVWLKFVLMPINREIERRLLDNGGLLEDQDLPDAVLDYFAHVSALDAVIAQWDAGNFKDYKSQIPYPLSFNKYLEDTYRKLLWRRRRLA